MAIVDFMEDHHLHSLLRSGTITWEHQTRNIHSTPDIVMGSQGVQEAIIQCQIHSQDYGLDHRPIAIKTGLVGEWYEKRTPRRNYQKADWAQIRERLPWRLAQAYPRAELASSCPKETLDRAAEQFTQAINAALEEMVPRARPSPMAKQWWSPELTALRRQLTQLRNAVHTQRRRGGDTEEALQRLQQARKVYFAQMDKQKAQHWREFLQDPDNLWKANRYTKGGSTTTQVPPLHKDGCIAQDDGEKAKMLMETFFPVPPPPEPPGEPELEQGGRTQPLYSTTR